MFCTAVNLVQEETGEYATSEQSGLGPYYLDCRLSGWCAVDSFHSIFHYPHITPI